MSSVQGPGVRVPKCVLDLCGVASRPLRSQLVQHPMLNDQSEIGIAPPTRYDIAQWHGEIRAKSFECSGQRTSVASLPMNSQHLAPKLISALAVKSKEGASNDSPVTYEHLSLKDLQAYTKFLQEFYPRNDYDDVLRMRRYLHCVLGPANESYEMRTSNMLKLPQDRAALHQELAIFAVMLAMGMSEFNLLHEMTCSIPNSTVRKRLVPDGKPDAKFNPLPHPLEIITNEVNNVNANWLAQVPMRTSGPSNFKFIVAKDKRMEQSAPSGNFPYFAPGNEPFLRFAEVVSMRHSYAHQEMDKDSSTKSFVRTELLKEYEYEGHVSASLLALRRRNGPSLRAKGWAYSNDIVHGSKLNDEASEGENEFESGVSWHFEEFSSELKAQNYIEVMPASKLVNSASNNSTQPNHREASPLTLFSRKIRQETAGKGLHVIVSLADGSPCLVPSPSLPVSSRTIWKPISCRLPPSMSPLGFMEPIMNLPSMSEDIDENLDEEFVEQCKVASGKLKQYVSKNTLWGNLVQVDKILSTECMQSEMLLPLLREQRRITTNLFEAEEKAEMDSSGKPLNYRCTSQLLPFSDFFESSATCVFETVSFALRTLGIGGTLVLSLNEIVSPLSVSLLFLLYRSFEQICLQIPETGAPAGSSLVVVTARHLREFRPEWALHIMDKVEEKIRGAASGNKKDDSNWSLASTWLIRPCEALYDREFVKSLRMIGHSLIRNEAYVLAHITRFALGRSRRRFLQPIIKRPFVIPVRHAPMQLQHEVNDEVAEPVNDLYDPFSQILLPEAQVGEEHVLLPFPPHKQELRNSTQGAVMVSIGMWNRL